MKNFSNIILACTIGLLAPELLLGQAVQEYIHKLTGGFEYALANDTHAVGFTKGSSKLSEVEFEKLKGFIELAKENICIKQIVLAAWSDQAYPAEKNNKLSTADQKLAKDRAEIVKTTLTKLGMHDIETHSMAEHPGWLSNLFHTTDSKIKGETSDKTEEGELIANSGKALQNAGGPFKVAVLIRTHMRYPRSR